jgi:hypothetical protein
MALGGRRQQVGLKTGMKVKRKKCSFNKRTRGCMMGASNDWPSRKEQYMKTNRGRIFTFAAMMTLGLATGGCGNHGAPQSEHSGGASAPSARLAQQAAGAARNLEWAGATLDNIEKDMAGVVEKYKPSDTGSLTSAFQTARAKLVNLQMAAKASQPDAGDLDAAIDFTKNVASLPQPLLDRIGDLDGKQETYHDLMADNPSLTNTDIGKRFDGALVLLAGDLARLTACQLEEKRNEACEAEGEWNLQGMRCDQIIDEGRDEAGYLARKEELNKNMREAGKTVSLRPLESARQQARAAKRGQQEAALAKQKLANQISALNLQNQILDENAGKLQEAVDQASTACDQAQERIQQAIDREDE